MDLLKKKYCKVFPLTIFITQCSDSEDAADSKESEKAEEVEEEKEKEKEGEAEEVEGEVEAEGEEEVEAEKVTFDDAKRFYIYTTIIKVNSDGSLKDDDTELFHNDTGYTIKKEFDENKIIQGSLLDGDNAVCESDYISNVLENHVYAANIVYDNDGNKDDEYKLYEYGFNAGYFFDIFFYKIINNKVSLYNSKEQKKFLDEVDDEINLYDISRNEDFKALKTYREKIYFILKQLFPDIDSNENRIISINGINLSKNDDENLVIYSNFIEKLQDGDYDEDNKIKIELDDYYKLNIEDILLSKDLEKIYKITDDKKNKLKDFLNYFSYESYKYSELQETLKRDANFENFENFKNFKNFKNITIENGNTDEYIKDLDKVIITITEDKGEGENKVIVPKQCTIKFEAGNGLFITDSTNYPATKSINFSEDEGGITTDTRINDYINTKYSAIKDKCTITSTNGEGVKFEDGIVVTVTINEAIEGITSVKDKNKVYVKVQFKISDNTKYKLRENILKLNNNELEFGKNNKISDLLNKIKGELDNTDLKNGYKIEKDNTVVKKESELVDGGVYIITLADDDSNFVEEIKKDKPEEPKGKHEDNTNNNNENDTTTKNGKGKGCCNKCSGDNKNKQK